MILLDERLTAVQNMVRPGTRVADVGTDHGYVIANLLLAGIATFGYACDIHEKPLKKARETLAAYGLAHQAACILGDGLAGLAAHQVDDIVIAGMGGDMILHILDAAGWKEASQRFVLQPMTRADELRRGLYARGYEILAEKAAGKSGFVYTVMQARWNQTPKSVSDLFAAVGLLPLSKEPRAKEYLERQRAKMLKIAAGLAKSADGQVQKEKYEILAGQIGEILADM